MSSNVQFEVHATPGARRNEVGGTHDGALRVWVTAPADKGRANQAIAKALAKALGLRAAQLELIRGQTTRRKLFAIHDAPNEIEQRLDELRSRA